MKVVRLCLLLVHIFLFLLSIRILCMIFFLARSKLLTDMINTAILSYLFRSNT